LNHVYNAWLSQFSPGYLTTGYADNITVDEEIPAFILADSAYANSKHLVTTFKLGECSDVVVAQLNKKLGGARYKVENAFGILKGRFQIFQRPLHCATQDIRFAILLIGACFVLHNFLIDVRDDSGDWAVNSVSSEREIGDSDDVEDNEPQLAGVETTRDILLRHFRWLLNDD